MKTMWTEEKLNELLTTPSEALISDMKKIKGDMKYAESDL